MTLREMIAAYPDKFYPQTWYDGEAFLDTEPNPALTSDKWFSFTYRPWRPHFMLRWAWLRYTAADIAYLWIYTNGTRPMFDKYLWTSDTDSQGQRVYVGQNGKGLEIHRHLHLTDRWRVPV